MTMIKEWVGYRLHLNAVFSTLSDTDQLALLRLLQAAEAASEAKDEQPVALRYGTEQGVHKDARRGLWVVRVSIRGVRRFGGYHSTKEAALLARNELIKSLAC